MDTDSVPRACAWCKGPISTDNPRALYCRNACRLAAGKAQRLATLKATTPPEQWPRCAQCGEPFLSLKPNQTTCSARCARTLAAAAINARRTAAPGPSQGDPASIARRAGRIRRQLDQEQPVGEDAARILWLAGAREWERVRTARGEATERLVLVGLACSLTVKDGALQVWEGVSSRPSGPLRRTLWPGTHNLTSIIITGHLAKLTGDALAWCRAQQISVMLFDRDAQDICYLTPPPKRDIALRTAQRRLSAEGRLSLARWLIRLKLEGQMATLRKHAWLPHAAEGADYLRQCLAWWDVPGCGPLSTIERLTMHEANAAKGYFGAWQGMVLPWLKGDVARVPPLYRTFEGRISPLSGTSQKAADPANAMLNFTYGVLAKELRRVLLSDGFDVDMGILHADQLDALLFDVMEPLRPVCDDLLLGVLRTCRLRYGAASEVTDGHPAGKGTYGVDKPQADGQCRLHPELQRTLASCCLPPHRALMARSGALAYRLLHGEVR